jgi:soluble lytic murein transglycosylase-like protein
MAGLVTGVDPALLSSLCFVESNHNINAYVHQDGGTPSYGLCQVKLETARALGFTGRAEELMDPSSNALYAALYLKRQHKRYGTWEKAVSAYNCGHACGNKSYVRKVMGGHSELRSRSEISLY